ncbi:hypothetical protein CKO09_06885 [Chromatium weissei]|nr:hypothetical protein [Chromatium weissei]
MLKTFFNQSIFDKQTYLFALTVLCIPALWFQITPWFDLDHNYRLHTPLMEQKYPISIGNPSSTVFVDAVMRDDITAFLEMLSTAGFVKGSSLFDLTGDSVGLVYAAGGKPVGTAWLLGGYQGSEKVFEYLIDSVDKTQLENAWLITSEDNPRHIKEWKEIWLRKFGKFTHTAVGMRCLRWPYKGGKFSNKSCYEITLWKPAIDVVAKRQIIN